MELIRNVFRNMAASIPNIAFTDVIDILVVAFVIYQLISLIRNTSAYRVVKGIVIILFVMLLTEAIHLNTVNFILGKVLELGAVAVVVVFQPELRRILERVGSHSFGKLMPSQDQNSLSENMISETVVACEILSRDRIGALIVFERNARLNEYMKSGTMLDAKVTSQLLRSIFYPKNALHDGAVIVQNQRIAAAGCVLPLTENTHINSDLGTRHRAAIGMSEISDAVIVIVSEETGTISVAVGGMLKRHLAPQMLEKLLKNELTNELETGKTNWLSRLKFILSNGGNHDEQA